MLLFAVSAVIVGVWVLGLGMLGIVGIFYALWKLIFNFWWLWACLIIIAVVFAH